MHEVEAITGYRIVRGKVILPVQLLFFIQILFWPILTDFGWF